MTTKKNAEGLIQAFITKIKAAFNVTENEKNAKVEQIITQYKDKVLTKILNEEAEYSQLKTLAAIKARIRELINGEDKKYRFYRMTNEVYACTKVMDDPKKVLVAFSFVSTKEDPEFNRVMNINGDIDYDCRCANSIVGNSRSMNSFYGTQWFVNNTKRILLENMKDGKFTTEVEMFAPSSISAAIAFMSLRHTFPTRFRTSTVDCVVAND